MLLALVLVVTAAACDTTVDGVLDAVPEEATSTTLAAQRTSAAIPLDEADVDLDAVDSCELLDGSEVERVLGGPIEPPVPGREPVFLPGSTEAQPTRSCRLYRQGEASYPVITVRATGEDAERIFASLADATEPVAELEGDVIWQPNGTTLWIRHGSFLISLQVSLVRQSEARGAAVRLGASLLSAMASGVIR